MLLAEARVLTDRSSRYLVQLCRHVSQLSQMHPHSQAQADWSDNRGVIEFGSGRCTLRADPGVLVLRAEAQEEATLSQIQQRLADRLGRIGRRDRLTVIWTPPRREADSGSAVDPGVAADDERTGR